MSGGDTYRAKMLDYYREAKAAVVAAGYEEELRWQRDVRLEDATAQSFLRDHAFVTLNSGMRASVIAGLWGDFRRAFDDWRFVDLADVQVIRGNASTDALRVFGNVRKVNAVMAALDRMAVDTWPVVHEAIRRGGVDYLGTWPYMGPIIRWHFAKNLGLDVAKPDRHMERLLIAFARDRYGDVQSMCQAISEATGDRVSVVDLVLWRYESTVKDSVIAERVK